MKTVDFVVAKRPRLSDIDRFPEVDFADYERRLVDLQKTLQRVQQAYLGTSHRAIIVLEGWDTAGKGGVVRRLGWALDPRSFKVHPIAAPGEREKALHYLQRFWERLPQRGQIVVFDRSWYGRVMVERVEGFAAKTEWRRAYEEINEFERMLVDDGRAAGKDLPPHHAGGAVTPLPRPAGRSGEALEAVLRGFPQPRALGGLRGGDRGHDGEDLDRARARGISSPPTTSPTAGSPRCASSPTGWRRASRSSRGRSIRRWPRRPSGCSA